MSKDTYSKVLIPLPTGWMRKYQREQVSYYPSVYKDDLDQPMYNRKGTFARNCVDYESCHEIEMRSNYNGGGPTAFGGANQWPAVTGKFTFNEGEYELAAKFAFDLAYFVDTWMRDQNR